MNGEPPVPNFTDDEVLERLRAAAKRGLTHTRNAESDLLKYDYDLEGVCELIGECTKDELHEHGLSDNYPGFNDYIVILKVALHGERHPFYVKVALALPDLESGELMSFHEWGLKR